jgi:hypothetical protein
MSLLKHHFLDLTRRNANKRARMKEAMFSCFAEDCLDCFKTPVRSYAVILANFGVSQRPHRGSSGTPLGPLRDRILRETPSETAYSTAPRLLSPDEHSKQYRRLPRHISPNRA